MDKEQMAIINASDAVKAALAPLSTSDRLALLATMAGEEIGHDPQRNRRRAYVKMHDEMVRGTVKAITGAK